MSTDAALLAQIAQLDKAINRQKLQANPSPPSYPPRTSTSSARGGRGRGGGSSFHRQPYPPSGSSSSRQVPRPTTSRNKKLVLNTAVDSLAPSATPSTALPASSSSSTTPSLPPQTLPGPLASTSQADQPPVASTSTASTQWIKTNDRHMSLMNPSAYAKRSSARQAAPSSTKVIGGVKLSKDDLERKKRRLGNISLVLNGVQAARNSAKRKNGESPARPGKRKKKSIALPCRYFTKTGRCNKALSCPYVHDPDKLSICQPFLRNSCANSASSCPLSHSPSAHNTPSCQHFARSGVCRAGEGCLYPHVRLPESALLCGDFGRYGWCERGSECKERHAWECKEFAEKGSCRMDGKCGLKHILTSHDGRTADSPDAENDDQQQLGFFVDSVGDRPARKDRVDSNALIANQDDFIQLDFDTDSEAEYETGSEEDEDDGEGASVADLEESLEGDAEIAGQEEESVRESAEDEDDEAEVADSLRV